MIDRPSYAAVRLGTCLALIGTLPGCAAQPGYPSLAPRAVERPAGPADETPAAPIAPVDAALDAQVAAIAARAAEGDAGFGRAADEACAAVTRGAGAAEGSEPWLAAQQALSAIDAARAPVLAAAAELDALLIDRGTATGAAVDLGRLTEAQATVSALDTAEQARVTALSAGRCSG